MNSSDILNMRFHNQFLTQVSVKKPTDLIAWFCAMQAQDYTGAKWGVGQRIDGATDEMIETAFANGEILRTHVMRPTWHFVHPSDIRWMLQLTGPRVSKLMATYNKLLELNEDVFAKAHKSITKLLDGKKTLTRQELKTALTNSNIPTNTQRLAHIVMEAEIRGLVCSGPRRGKQFTYMLLEERVPKAKKLDRDEALAELTKRYFQSHGPATIRDFGWWSGLTFTDVKRGIEMQGAAIKNEVIGDKIYWLYESEPPPVPKKAYLLPNYDEYGIAYTEREAFFKPEYNKLLNARGNAVFQHLIVYEGQIIGTWKKTEKKDNVIIETKYFEKPSGVIKQAIQVAIENYSAFLNRAVSIG